MSEHLTTEQVQRFLRGQLPRDQVAAVAQHFAQCELCKDAGLGNAQVNRSTAALRQRLAAREVVSPWTRTLRTFALAAAVAAAVISIAFFLNRREIAPPAVNPPVVATQPPLPPQWAALVYQAKLVRAIAMPPELAELRVAPDAERTLPAPRNPPALEPYGAIVETTRPTLRWAAVSGATYVVTVMDGPDVIVESKPLREASWQLDRDLSRGRVYHWQVDVRDARGSTILPAPPAPPALFRILDEASLRELDQARAARPSDHLLLGILYASKGLRADAERELAAAPDAEAGALLRSVQSWR